ncbi:MAG: TRAP transporter large permease [Caldisericaceae bacterium]|nr:TRAP transporter large permease [Caldisericaceae bacterium]
MGGPATLLLILFVVLLLIGVPIAVALGFTAVITIMLYHMGILMISRNFYASIASFPLLAIPFFVLAGMILEKARLAEKIARFLELLVGRSTGGLAIVAVLTAMFWGAISGSGPATTAAVGLILIVPMVKNGYDKYFAAGTIATASSLSIIIPPSIAFIIYGNITSVSVSGLFVGGLIPGILTGLFLVVAAYYVSRKRGYKGTRARGSFKEIMIALKEAIWAILAPVIILGGIYAGVFTPTEAAVVAVFYSLFVATVIYHTLDWHTFMDTLIESSVTSAVIMAIVAFAGIFSWTATVSGVVERTAQWMIHVSKTPMMFILLIDLLLLGLGMILDAISITYLVVPLVTPVLAAFHIDPLWYGVIFVVALAIGQATPPVGVNLFTAAGLIHSDLDPIAREAVPYVIAAVIALIIISLIPALSLYLPVHAGLYKPIP